MSGTNDQLISAAIKASKSVPVISSLDLPNAIDPTTKESFPSWRLVKRPEAHPLHGMVSRVGGFPAPLARYFIHRYSTEGDLVADPFCGKGTTLLEALIAGRDAVGGDVALDAVFLTRAKLTRLSVAEVANYIQSLPDGDCISIAALPDDIKLFYSRRTLREIIAIRERLLTDVRRTGKERHVATFILAVMLGLLHGHSRLSLSLPCNQAFAMSPNYVRRYVKDNGLQAPDRSVHKSLLERSLQLLPFADIRGEGRAYHTAAQLCDSYISQRGRLADLIITSPPYLNRQTYIKDSWIRLWFVGSDTARPESSLETASISKFVLQMQDTLQTIAQSLKVGARAVLVCGKAKIDVGRETRSVKIAELCMYALKSLGSSIPLAAEKLIIDRVVMKRGSYFAVHHGLDKKDCPTRSKRFGEDEILVLKRK